MPDNLSIDHWLNVFLDRKEKTVKSSTYSTYSKNVRLLRAAFGQLKVTEIKKRHVREWCEKLTCGNKQTSMLIIRLRDAINCAVDDEVIDSNPLTGFAYKKLEEPGKQYTVDPLTTDELERLLVSLDHLPGVRNLVKFAVWTGLRTSELIAVEWGDVDFVRGVIRVQRGKTQAASKAETTKTRSGTRDVKLLPPALEALSAQKKHTLLAGKQIFMNGSCPYTGDFQVWTQWRRALLKAGVRYRNPYQTRHTYASMMLTAGESINWLAQQMGHTSVMTTLKHYARFMPDADDKHGLKAVGMYAEKRI